ncbi:MAG: glycosyltransferase, partial [bacterium]
MKNDSKIWLLILLTIIIILFTYKIYAPYSIEDFNAQNIKNMNIVKNNVNDEKFSFAVVGDIENSIAIFDNRILNELKQKNIDFIISTGNNLLDSDEGKYRVFYRTLQKLDIPFITVLGENEFEDEGQKNFYKYFGPFYFSFQIEDNFFIFLDTTGNTNFNWQKEWLINELESAKRYKNKFVIMNKTPLKLDAEYLIKDKKSYINSEEDRNFYQDAFRQYNVDAVFSSNMPLYHENEIGGVDYFISGGAGGDLIVDNENSFYHYLTVEVDQQSISYNLNRIKTDPGVFSKIMLNIWVTLQSFIYTNYLNILIVFFILLTVFYFLHREVNKEIDYYRNFAYSEEKHEEQKYKIAMFTNNYFPVIGGVPISIKRLSKALEAKGHQVKIYAPKYKKQSDIDEKNIFRCSILYYYKEAGLDMPVTNIFSPQIKKDFEKENFDIVHCHHPFWLGSKGRRLAEKNNIPAAFTYHTRLEKYAHYVPDIFFMRKFFANRLSHFLIKNFSNKTDAVFAPTESTKEYLRNVGVSRYIHVLPTGIDFDNYDIEEEKINKIRSQYLNDYDFLLLTVARLSKEKNLYFLLDGIKKLKEKSDFKFKLLIIGEGSEKENLESYIKENDLDENIEMIGAVDFREISKYYLAADLFVFASTSETQGMVLLEAMAGYT